MAQKNVNFELNILKKFIDETFPLNEGNDKPYRALHGHLKNIRKYIRKLERANDGIKEERFMVQTAIDRVSQIAIRDKALELMAEDNSKYTIPEKRITYFLAEAEKIMKGEKHERT